MCFEKKSADGLNMCFENKSAEGLNMCFEKKSVTFGLKRNS